jgi:hypothetical protein
LSAIIAGSLPTKRGEGIARKKGGFIN